MAERVALLAAGGTGGHLFPAEALAEVLIARGWDVHLATDSRAGRFAGGFRPDRVHAIESATISGRNPISLAGSFLKLWKGFRQSNALMARIKPAVVVGFGGYPTLPPLFAATRRGLPCLLHEQNAVMGRANKALAPRVNAIAGGFLNDRSGPHAARTITTGNPVRPAVLDAAKLSWTAAAGGKLNLLVFGGSQGAAYFSTALPLAIERLPAELRARLSIVQQARAEDEDAVRTAYRALGVPAEVSPFFSDMAAKIAAADLIVSRSGASTVSEIAVIGRPAILVPYPHALDHDQAANAAALAEAGGGLVRAQSDLDPETLAGLLGELLHDPARLARMAEAARSVGRPDAATLLADLTESIASGESVESFKRKRGP